MTNTSYTAFASSVTITFTPTITATFKIYVVATIFCPASATIGLKIVTTGANTPTTVFVQEAIFDTIATSNVRQTAAPYSLYTLTGGTAYTFTLQAKSSSGQITLTGADSAAGIALVAEQVSG